MKPTLTPEQQALVTSHLHVIDIVSRSIARKVRTIPKEELRSLGHEGLVRAALRWDKELGVPFQAFALMQVRWTIMTGVHREVVAWNRWRRAAFEAGAEWAASYEADADLAFAGDDEVQAQYESARNGFALTLVAGLVGRAGDVDGVGDAEVEVLAERHRLRSMLERMLAELQPRDRELVEQHYFEGRELKDMTSEGASYATVRRRHAAVMTRLGARMRTKVA